MRRKCQFVAALDTVSVRYPSLRDFMEIELTPEFRSIYRHKVAAMSPICSPATVPTLPES